MSYHQFIPYHWSLIWLIATWRGCLFFYENTLFAWHHCKLGINQLKLCFFTGLYSCEPKSPTAVDLEEIKRFAQFVVIVRLLLYLYANRYPCAIKRKFLHYVLSAVEFWTELSFSLQCLDKEIKENAGMLSWVERWMCELVTTTKPR